MNVLILNQAFYPDVVSVAQHAADLATALADRGHKVTVVASRRAYDSPCHTFPPSEVWHGVRILRVPSTAFGKKALWRRICDFSTFYLACFVQLATLPRFDVVIAMTVPPLISVLAAIFIRVRGGQLVSWVMDLNPDEAIAAGALKEKSPVAKILAKLLSFSFASSDAIVVLDRYMKERVAAKGVPQDRLHVIAPWSHDSVVRFDEAGRERFRAAHGLTRHFVVMYSGNHSPCHPLDTLLDAARVLANEPSILFLFIGGGSQFASVKEFARLNSLSNILCLPYQPLSLLAASLSAADLHVVVMGEKFVGIVHPCKIYNIMAIGSPFLYIGPFPNHITDLSEASPSPSAHFARHGDTEAVVSCIRSAAARGPVRDAAHAEIAAQFSETALISQMISIIERLPDCHVKTLWKEMSTSKRANEQGIGNGS